jgi:hypothetical protein
VLVLVEVATGYVHSLRIYIKFLTEVAQQFRGRSVNFPLHRGF